MTRFLAYAGPHDSIDLREYVKQEHGAAKPDQYVFHTQTNEAVHADQRGTILEVPNEIADDLLTFPGHTFVDVPEEQAKPWIEKQAKAAKIREERQKLYAQHEQAVAARQRPALSFPVTTATGPEIAPMAPRSAAEVRADVQAETKALKAQAKE